MPEPGNNFGVGHFRYRRPKSVRGAVVNDASNLSPAPDSVTDRNSGGS